MMSEKEIVEMLRTNERGFCFLPKEVQEWIVRHPDDCIRLNPYSSDGSGWVFGDPTPLPGMVHRVRADYQIPEPPKPKEERVEVVRFTENGQVYILMREESRP